MTAMAVPRKPRYGTPEYTRYLELRRCGNKIKYTAEWLAQNAITILGWINVTGFESYECEFCDHWHIGHPWYRVAPEYVSPGTINALAKLEKENLH